MKEMQNSNTQTNPQDDVQHRRSRRLHANYEGFRGDFGVHILYEEKGRKEQLQYHSDIRCFHDNRHGIVWTEQKQQHFVNSITPQNPLHALAAACIEKHGPIRFTTGAGRRPNTIVAHEELQKRFSTAKEILLRDFSGDLAEDYIAQMESVIADKAMLLQSLQYDLWLTIFFADIYVDYPISNFERPMQLRLPVFGFDTPVLFNGIAKADFNLDLYHMRSVVYTGRLDIETLPGTVSNTHGPSAGEINLVYKLDGYRNHILGITCNISIETKHGPYNIALQGFQLQDRKWRIDVPAQPVQQTKKETWMDKWFWSLLWQ